MPAQDGDGGDEDGDGGSHLELATDRAMPQTSLPATAPPIRKHRGYHAGRNPLEPLAPGMVATML
eukprot:6596407-Pyramimonas_sp.AAC.1